MSSARRDRGALTDEQDAGTACRERRKTTTSSATDRARQASCHISPEVAGETQAISL
jgi:hypothetical protein